MVFRSAVPSLDLKRSFPCHLADVWWIHGLGEVVKWRVGRRPGTVLLLFGGARGEPKVFEVKVEVADRRKRSEACGLAMLAKRGRDPTFWRIEKLVRVELLATYYQLGGHVKV